MKIIRGINNIRERNSNLAVTIGNFDGVHLGHQKLFLKTYKIGVEYNISTMIILFEPQPLEFFKNNFIPTRITTFREKIQRILPYRINNLLCIKFNQKFRSLSPEDFIINVLINKLHIKFIIVGEDFRFGSKRSGNIDLLKKLGEKYKFNVLKIKRLHKNNIKISSTNIRKALSEDNIKLASMILGRPFSILGKVVYGNAIGRQIGYPTANISLDKKILLNNGVYAVKVHFLNKIFLGISNIGIKPSFINIEEKKILEVHLFNIKINLYGENIEVILYKKIRDEKIFLSKEELKNQISEDIRIVKKYFKIKNN